jgi:hypothetical protein
MRTEDLTFYHGTGAAAARAILACGSRDSLFEEIGARKLGRVIRQALLANWGLSPGEDWRLHFLVKGPGSEYSGLWVSALSQLDEPNNQSLIEYGRFFATLNIGMHTAMPLVIPTDRSSFKHSPRALRSSTTSATTAAHGSYSLPRDRSHDQESVFASRP